MVNALISAGASVDQADKIGWTALMYAAQNSYDSVVSALISAGASVDQAKGDGATPLFIAADKCGTVSSSRSGYSRISRDRQKIT